VAYSFNLKEEAAAVEQHRSVLESRHVTADLSLPARRTPNRLAAVAPRSVRGTYSSTLNDLHWTFLMPRTIIEKLWDST